MKTKIKLCKDFMGHKSGAVIEVDAGDVKSLVDSGVGETVGEKKRVKLLKDFSGQKSGAVIEVEEADAKSLIDSKIAEDAPAEDGQKAVDELLLKFTEGLESVMAQAGQRFIKAANKSAKSVGTAMTVKTGIASARSDFGDDENFGYKGLGDFAIDVRAFSNPTKSGVPDRLAGYMAKAPSGMNESLGEEGGVLIPPQFGQGIYERVFDQQNLVGNCDVYNLTGNTIEFNGLSDDSRANGSRWGGVLGQWLGEAGQLTSSKPKFTPVKLRLNKLGVLVYVTDEQLADSAVALDQWLSKKASDEINFLTSDSIINGNGSNKPLGILNSPGRVSVARTTTSKIKFDDISNMWNSMWSPFRGRAAWYINQEIEPQLDQLTFEVKNVAGTENVGGWPLYIPPGGLNTSPYGMLKGRPVIPLEFSSALGVEGDIMLADMSQYLVGTKQGVQSAMSIHLRFDYDETAFRFIYRIDGQPWWNKPVTPYKGTSGKKYSPYVTLAA